MNFRGVIKRFNTNPVDLIKFGLTDFKYTWNLQKKLQKEVISGHCKSTILFTQHYPVYTLGRGASLDNIKFDINDRNFELHRIERGGQVTYHNPGQIVIYPILNLCNFKKDLHWYLRQIEEIVIRMLKIYDLNAYRIPGMTGVWINDRKIAACGIHVNQWVTIHGLSINVENSLEGFKNIIPCGLIGKEVCSLKQFIPSVSIEDVEIHLEHSIEEIFNCKLIKRSIIF